MNLNSTNIPYILKRLSCCITNFGSLLYKQSQIGNKDCFEDTVEDILILNSIYKILDKSTTITYPKYQFFLTPTLNPTVCVCNIIDNTTDTILAQGYNTGSVSPIKTSQYAINLALNNLSNNYPCYSSTINYDNTLDLLTVTITNSCECISNLTIHLFQPMVDTPPYGGIDPTQVAVELQTTNISQTYIPGNCSNMECFTQEELNNLYQQSLNICKDCNCS